MVLTLIIGGLLTVGAGLLLASQVGTILHIIAVAGAGLAGAGLFYNSYMERFLGIESDALAVITYASVGTAVSFVVFRFLEAVFAALGFAAAFLLSLIIVASIVFSPQVVGQVLGYVVNLILGFAGDN